MLVSGRIVASGDPAAISAHLGDGAGTSDDGRRRRSRARAAAARGARPDLHSDYAGSPVLFDIDLQVGAAEIVALIGRNGMGKTTLVRSIMGLTRPTSGQVTIEGHASVGLSAHHNARLGIALVPKWPPPRGRLPMAAVL